MCGSGGFGPPLVEVEAMTSPPRPPRDDPVPRDTTPKPLPCVHPSIKKINGKICCAKCGVQLYL
jgi:hypothetical protein